MKFPPILKATARNYKYPLLFATVSGAHLYGFPSPDSDYDLRGVHVLPVTEVVGLKTGEETIEVSEHTENIELDLVTHDIRKFFNLLLKKNGYVLEQLYSPLIIHTCPAHEELKEIATGCITKHHYHHYRGFADTQWKLVTKEEPPRIKPLLYLYRVLLTGIHLMRTGIVEANLLELNEEFRLPYINDLVYRKSESREKQCLADADIDFHKAEYDNLLQKLEQASASSKLPEAPSAHAALDDLLKRVRLETLQIYCDSKVET
jgi:predicted nucleotidyltransferase